MKIKVSIFKSRALQPEKLYEAMVTETHNKDGDGYTGHIYNAGEWKLIKDIDVEVDDGEE